VVKLRTRLALAIVGLVAVALGLFGVGTTGLYERSLARQLDEELQANAQGQAGRLLGSASRFEFDLDTCEPVGADLVVVTNPLAGPGAAPGQGLDAYAELRDPDGTPVACSLPVTTEGRPELPQDLVVGTSASPTYLTVSDADGNGSWRVLAMGLPDAPTFAPGSGAAAATTTVPPALEATDAGQTVIVAVRTDGTDASLRRLVRIELGASIALLAAVGGGAWLVLRRGLRPLEEMADTAASITGSERGLRVQPAEERTEVGRLGLALNTMLDGIERSFDERDATEARLRQFLADASHELRTPLTSIQGYAELSRLTADPQAGGDALDRDLALARIEAEAARMRVLVEDLLLLARLDERAEAERQPVDLAIVAAEACAGAAALPGDHPIDLDVTEPVVVLGVATHLHRAVTNLLANAVRHTPDGTRVEVSVVARPATARAVVVVRDHGPGLGASGLARAFDRFWQADAARAGASTGLGLSIVAGIAAEHGGTASVSDAPDGGAVFTLDLPLADGVTGGAAAAVGPAERSPHR
jgi:two-component system OmpR family sensor kinase